jgi:hypothetical protein
MKVKSESFSRTEASLELHEAFFVNTYMTSIFKEGQNSIKGIKFKTAHS